MSDVELTAERLRELLSYNAQSGRFTWLAKSAPGAHICVGDFAGGDSLTEGYVRITIRRKRYLAHRLAWLYVTGEWPPAEIDHINGERNDNRWANLRAVSKAGNQQNRRTAQVNNLAGYLGVSKKKRRWSATIVVDGKNVHLGGFATPEAAHIAYVDAKRALHPHGTL